MYIYAQNATIHGKQMTSNLYNIINTTTKIKIVTAERYFIIHFM